MAARDSILNAIRSYRLATEPLPDLEGPWITYPDPVAQFTAVLEMIGGRCVRVPTLEAAHADLIQQPAYQAARQIVSTVPGVGVPNLSLPSVSDPHALCDVDLAILPGHLAVAENGAVWVSDQDVPHRAIYFLCTHLVLVVSSNAVVPNLYEAYQRLRLPVPGFGAFISGPSKTADIEQSLVIGAHGPKSATVYLIG